VFTMGLAFVGQTKLSVKRQGCAWRRRTNKNFHRTKLVHAATLRVHLKLPLSMAHFCHCLPSHWT